MAVPMAGNSMRSIALALIIVLAGCGDSAEPVETTGLIIFIGDSITEGWPLEKYAIGVVNAGIGGQETPDLLARFELDVLARHPAAVVILGGINDINRRAVADPGSILTMAEMALSANVQVFVGTLLPVSGPLMLDATGATVLINEFNNELDIAAPQYGYQLVNFHDAMLRSDGHFNGRLFSDGVHPSKAGYTVMWNTLDPLLREKGLLREE